MAGEICIVDGLTISFHSRVFILTHLSYVKAVMEC